MQSKMYRWRGVEVRAFCGEKATFGKDIHNNNECYDRVDIHMNGMRSLLSINNKVFI